MSFTAQVKTELANSADDGALLRRAYAYGFLLFGKSFSSRSIYCASDYECVINSFKNTVCELYGIDAAVGRLKSGKHTLKINSLQERKKLIESFDHSANEISLRINHGVFEMEECYPAFLKGAFLSCGSVSNPENNYHLEFVVQHAKLSYDLLKILTDLEINAKYILRKYSHVIYIKDSESIEDLLTMMGAVNSSLSLMGIKVQKDVKNKINRQMNFETANMSRAIEAGLAQVRAINIIAENQSLESLPEDLRELALMRLENPDMSLKELGERLSEPLSRSGVNHRLDRIIQIAEKYTKQ